MDPYIFVCNRCPDPCTLTLYHTSLPSTPNECPFKCTFAQWVLLVKDPS